jgi:predicted nucleic acid-binding protein
MLVRELEWQLWPFEVANALAIAERRKRITREGIEAFLETLRRLPIQIERREAVWLLPAMLRLAREHRLTAYDAAYLELARREDLNLATLDHDLPAAGRTLGVASSFELSVASLGPSCTSLTTTLGGERGGNLARPRKAR